MSRRPRALGLVAAAVATALLAACASPTDAAPQGSAAADKPLVIALNAALASIDPVKANSQRTEGNILTSVYSTLTQTDPQGELKGDLATGWTQTDPYTWVFTIRDGVTFTNGDPLGPDEVVKGIQRYFDPDLGSKGLGSIPTFKSAAVQGDHDVVITTTSPELTLPDALEQFYLVDPLYAADHDLGSDAVGSGPYKIVSYDPQGTITLTRNDGFYGTAPAFKDVTFKVIPEEASRVSALKAGEIDVLTSFDPQSLDQVESIDGLNVGATEGLRTHFILLDTRQKPLDDVRVRQALNYAVDKQSIADSIFKGLTKPGLYITEGTLGYDPDLLPYAYDPEKAKALLKEAGYGDGLKLEILNAPGSYAGDDLTVQAVADQLSKVGVTLTIKNLPYTTYLQYVLEQDGKKADPLNFRSFAGSSKAALVNRYTLLESTNTSSLNGDAEYDKLVEKAREGLTYDEQDALFRKANDYLYDQAQVIYLFNEPLTYAYSKSLSWVPRGEQWLRPFDFTPAS